MTSSGGGAPYLGWLDTRMVSGGPWPAMTLAENLVIASAPQHILMNPPADLHYGLALGDDASGTTVVLVSRIAVPNGQEEDGSTWSGAVWLESAIGSPEDLRLSCDREDLDRASRAHPADLWAVLEDLGLFPSKIIDQSRAPDTRTWEIPELNGRRRIKSVILRDPERERSIFCSICPWWCQLAEPDPTATG